MKSSLEEAIKNAKGRVSVFEGDEIVLDRSQFASRANGKVAVVTQGTTMDTNMDMPSTISATKDLSIEAKYWRNLYLTLKQENNEEYQDVESLLQLTIDREAQLMTYARLLERKVDSIIAPVGDDSESIELSRKL